jgi:hypothetical protein
VILEEQDGLRGDNASRFAARVVEALKVLVLNPQPGKTPATDEAFYLTTALDPEGAGSNKPAPIRATIRSSAKLSDLNLDGFDCIVLSGGGGFEPLDLRALREYLRRGGGLLVFPGQTQSAASLGRELADVLPASLGAEKKAPQGSPFRLDSGGISHPALQPLKDPEAVDLGAAAFESVFDMQLPSPPEGSRVLLRLAGGAPALAEREFGQGRVILASFSAGVSRGDFALRPAYLPLLHQLVAHLAAGNSLSRSLRTGDPIAARFDVGQADEPVRVSGPGGLDATLAAEVGGDGAIARLPMSRGAGIYRFEASGGKQEAFAVNVPEAESNLSHAGPNEVRERTGLKEMRFATDLEDIAGLADRARKGSEVWRPLILAAILLLFAEAFLAQRFGRRTIG